MNRLPVAYVGYHGRSCVTARELAKKLNDIQAGGFRWRRIGTRKAFKFKPEVFLRWGNSTREVHPETLDIQPQTAVDRAATKFKMMEQFLNHNIPVPPIVMNYGSLFRENVEALVAEHRTDRVYVRGKDDIVRYTCPSGIRPDDRYVTIPIERDREFRVHIFDGKTIGVYEKVPYEEGAVLMKNETCRFQRLDMSDKDTRKELNGMRPLARAAVHCLGLLFGGVDVIKSKSGNYVITEVNSAPSLNTPNLERWASELDFYIREVLSEDEEHEENEEEEAYL